MASGVLENQDLVRMRNSDQPFFSFSDFHAIVKNFGKEGTKYFISWAVLGILALCYGLTELLVDPHDGYFTVDQINNSRFPKQQATVSEVWVVVIALVIPFVFFLIKCLVENTSVKEFHDLVYALLLGIVLAGFSTTLLKLYVGRIRPDFIERCYGVNNYTLPNTIQKLECTKGESSHDVKDGRKSFPSGHSSWSMLSMGFCSLFLMGKLEVFNGNGKPWQFIVSMCPIAFAVFVGTTRVHDYKHHWSDVIVGSLIGLFYALLVYLMYYPSPFNRSRTREPLSVGNKQNTHEYGTIDIEDPDAQLELEVSRTSQNVSSSNTPHRR